MSYGNGIKLTAGFDVGAKTPLDSKSRVETIAERDAFVTNNLAYEGLEVYVVATKKKYRFNGTDWIDLDSNTGGTGLTETQAANLTGAYNHSLSDHAPVNAEKNVQSDWSVIDENSDAFIKNKPTIPTETSQLTNNSGYITADTISSDLTFQVGSVTQLEAGSAPTVSIRGTYPNFFFDFGIPVGGETLYMYYGRLSYQDVGGSVIQYNQITEDMIKKGVTDGKLTKETSKTTMGKTSMGAIADTAAGDYIIMVVPAAKNYTVTKDNGIGGKVIFDEETAGANGIDITIDSVACKLYGEMLISQGEMFLYVDKKEVI